VRVPPEVPHDLSADQCGRRALSGVLLSYAASLGTREAHVALGAHYDSATNMAEATTALAVLADTPCAQAAPALAHFEAKWATHREVIDTWLTVQATSSLPGAAARLRELMGHASFSLTNPNKVRAVIGCLSTAAPAVLFQPDVLALVGEVICAVDATNGNLAASLCKMLQGWRKLPPPLRDDARAVLQAVLRREGCSKNAAEVASTALR